jgi:hypothetical protein
MYINDDKSLGDTRVVLDRETVLAMYRDLKWDAKNNEEKMTDEEIIKDFESHDVVKVPVNFDEQQALFFYDLMEEENFSYNNAEEIVDKMIDLEIENFDRDIDECLCIYDDIQDYGRSLIVERQYFGDVEEKLIEYIDLEQLASDVISLDRPLYILEFNYDERIIEIFS